MFLHSMNKSVHVLKTKLGFTYTLKSSLFFVDNGYGELMRVDESQTVFSIFGE